jgi:hypothetical protein
MRQETVDRAEGPKQEQESRRQAFRTLSLGRAETGKRRKVEERLVL